MYGRYSDGDASGLVMLALIAIVIILAIVVACSSSACVTTKGEADDTLQKAGFTDVQSGGWDWFTCSDGDKEIGREFEATNPAGQRIRGTVCCGFAPFGIGKGCTIRY